MKHIYIRVIKTDDPDVYGGEEYYISRKDLIRAYNRNKLEAIEDYFEVINSLFERSIGAKTPVEPEVMHMLISLLLENPKCEGVYASIFTENDELFPRYEIREAESEENDEFLEFNLGNLEWV